MGDKAVLPPQPRNDRSVVVTKNTASAADVKPTKDAIATHVANVHTGTSPAFNSSNLNESSKATVGEHPTTPEQVSPPMDVDSGALPATDSVNPTYHVTPHHSSVADALSLEFDEVILNEGRSGALRRLHAHMEEVLDMDYDRGNMVTGTVVGTDYLRDVLCSTGHSIITVFSIVSWVRCRARSAITLSALLSMHSPWDVPWDNIGDPDLALHLTNLFYCDFL